MQFDVISQYDTQTPKDFSEQLLFYTFYKFYSSTTSQFQYLLSS